MIGLRGLVRPCKATRGFEQSYAALRGPARAYAGPCGPVWPRRSPAVLQARGPRLWVRASGQRDRVDVARFGIIH
eukprot:4320105-Lingulodinium_polyedra.AAC.1